MSSEDFLEREKTWYENAREQENRSRAVDEAINQAEAAARKEAYDLLRAQVRDFVEWLKREGAN